MKKEDHFDLYDGDRCFTFTYTYETNIVELVNRSGKEWTARGDYEAINLPDAKDKAWNMLIHMGLVTE